MKYILRRYFAYGFIFLILAFAGMLAFSRFTPARADLHFRLTDHRGRIVTEKDFSGSSSLVFFGYTRCPTICPLTLARLSEVQEKLAGQRQKINILFITLDPAHDTPEVMKQYLAHFPAKITGLTGPHEKLEPVYKALDVYPGHMDGRTAPDHSGFVFLADGRGHFRAHFTAQMSVKKMTHLITETINREKDA